MTLQTSHRPSGLALHRRSGQRISYGRLTGFLLQMLILRELDIKRKGSANTLDARHLSSTTIECTLS